ncbi:phosphotransferase [Nonomuraea sp. NPDC050536]|uniref:phosphotransferase n=1 Tax=Nonomuraea sp. NPDC050536 TaxID=3364366 RepID=UPI0037C591A3
MSGEYAEVFRCFGIPPQESIYPYAPVFRGDGVAVKRTHSAEGMGRWVGRLASAGFPVVTPVAGPHRIGEYDWVAYPWIDGRGYACTPEDIAAAGTLLGRLHALGAEPAGLNDFSWPDRDAGVVEEDVAGLDKAMSTYRPELREEVLARLAPLLRGFMDAELPAVRQAGLPWVDASMDFKANNLVYTEAGPVLIDPDNGERVPRVLDLALAVLLFHNDLGDRLFTAQEWAVFARAYLGEVELTADERRLWPVALRYMLLEWGVWTVVNGLETGDWDDPRQASFLTDLVTVDLSRFDLSTSG